MHFLCTTTPRWCSFLQVNHQTSQGKIVPSNWCSTKHPSFLPYDSVLVPSPSLFKYTHRMFSFLPQALTESRGKTSPAFSCEYSRLAYLSELKRYPSWQSLYRAPPWKGPVRAFQASHFFWRHLPFQTLAQFFLFSPTLWMNEWMFLSLFLFPVYLFDPLLSQSFPLARVGCISFPC